MSAKPTLSSIMESLRRHGHEPPPVVAFEVDDLDAALVGQEVIHPPGSPSDGVRSAMILADGAPVELIWFSRNVRSVMSPSSGDDAP